MLRDSCPRRDAQLMKRLSAHALPPESDITQGSKWTKGGVYFSKGGKTQTQIFIDDLSLIQIILY